MEQIFDKREGMTSELTDRVLEYIHTHFSEDITLHTLAVEFFYSSGHICRVFKREMGCTFAVYLRSVRMEHAIRLLESGEYSISETACKCGYSTQAFYPIFKEYTGFTPAVICKKTCKSK